jgi:hypothetical protein
MKVEIESEGKQIIGVLPYKFQNLLDEQLDYASLEVERINISNFSSLTEFGVSVSADGETESEDWLVAADTATETPVGNGTYRHFLTLIEYTKFLEGFLGDSLCTTYAGGRTYTEGAPYAEPEIG